MKKTTTLSLVGLFGIGTLFLSGCGLQQESESSNEIHLWTTISTTAQGVTVNGTSVTITQSGIYILNGNLTDGEIVVDATGQDVELILSGVNITNADGPAILFKNTNTSMLTLADGTTNSLSDGVLERDYDATLYSVASLTIQGNGSLDIVGNYQEGIATELHMTINGGDIAIQSADDGLNANNDGVSIITVNGGELTIDAEWDGIDSNGTLVINGGKIITASALTDMSGGIDADGDVTINGGEVLALGARNSVPVTSSQQKTIVASLSGTATAWSTLTIQSGDITLFSYVLTKDVQQIVYSSSEIQEGVSYDIYISLMR